jgi:hypothetical protein
MRLHSNDADLGTPYFSLLHFTGIKTLQRVSSDFIQNQVYELKISKPALIIR